uniref:Phosphatidylinositol-4-phosphate 5-kinase family protein n=1 Tax=Rhizophora mucronata TaxID=61149 RepID=A0A2P2JQP2_RHIMU
MLRVGGWFDLPLCQRVDKKVFVNGETYIGHFKGALPYEKGKYTWSDGTAYEGDWEAGQMTGKGQIHWPSGAKYEGDVSGGCLHGSGTFVAPNGSEYSGAWRMNIQHGVGRKKYSNSDIYEGSWKEGLREGSGKYSWNSGNTYVGNWKGGTMCGRGVMRWVNGDIFDGAWLSGFRHGSGVYRFADGGYYFGMWSKGLKDGKGTFYPAGTRHPSLRRWNSSLTFDDSGRSLLSYCSLNSEEGSVSRPSVMRSLSEKMSTSEDRSISDHSRETMYDEPSYLLYHTSDRGQGEMQDQNTVVYEREYMQGVLIKELVRNAELPRRTKERNKFYVKKAKWKCVDKFKGRRSYYLRLNLQLGIRYTVGKITPVPMREVRASDFGERARIGMYFPRKGSKFTPPHYSIDFHWKDYCPMVFR